MVDWLATHTGRFKCLITHAGDWDEVSTYGATEELWFEDWEMGGPYWSNPEMYRKWSPMRVCGGAGKIQDADAGDRRRTRLSECPTRRAWNFSAHCSDRACRRSWWFSPTRATGF